MCAGKACNSLFTGHHHCTKVHFASLLSGGFITATVVNPPERKLAKRTSVHCVEKARGFSLYQEKHLKEKRFSKLLQSCFRTFIFLIFCLVAVISTEKKCKKATGEFSTPRTEDLDLRCTVMRIVVIMPKVNTQVDDI